MKVKIFELETIVKKILSSTYYSKAQEENIAEVLIYGEIYCENLTSIQ